MGVAPHILNWTLDECGCQFHVLASLTWGKYSWYPLDRRFVGPQGESASLEKRNGIRAKAELIKNDLNLNSNRKMNILKFGTLFSECILCSFGLLLINYVYLIHL
jgi:hypothetical protein